MVRRELCVFNETRETMEPQMTVGSFVKAAVFGSPAGVLRGY
jgi:hypothetical protein